MFHVKQSEYPVRLGQVLDLTITGYTSEGQGVARVEGLAGTPHLVIPFRPGGRPRTD